MAYDEYSFPTRPRASAQPIDPDDAAERDRWCAELKVSEERLRIAIAAVGAMPEAVRGFIATWNGPRRPKARTEEEKAAFLANRAVERGRRS